MNASTMPRTWILLVGPLHPAQGDSLCRQLARDGERIAWVDTHEGFETLWRTAARLLRRPGRLLVVDLEPTSDGAYLGWLRSELQRLAREAGLGAAAGPWVTLSALGRRGLDSQAIRQALDDPGAQADCQDIAPPASHPDWSAPPAHRRHVFLCTGPRCVRRGALPLWKALRRRLLEHQRLETPDGVLLTRSGCQFPCNRGPVLTVYPDGCWYGVASLAQVDRVVDEHLLHGRPVAGLRLPAPGDAS